MGIGGRARSVPDHVRVAAKALSNMDSTGVDGNRKEKNQGIFLQPHGLQHTPGFQEG